MTEESSARPIAEFALKFRGYSRRQVDQYVDATRELFEKAEARAGAANAESSRWRDEAMRLGQRVAELEQQLTSAPPRSFVALRERLDHMLAAAEEVTTNLIAQAEVEAREVVTSTRERAEAGAAEMATHLVGQARQILERAEVHRAQLLEVLANERSQREELLAALAPLSVGLSQVVPGVAQLQESLLRSVGQLTPGASEPAGELPAGTEGPADRSSSADGDKPAEEVATSADESAVTSSEPKPVTAV